MSSPQQPPTPQDPAGDVDPPAMLPGMAGLPRPKPLDPPMVPYAVAGLVAWAVVGLVLLLFFRGWLAEHGRTDWLWTCLAGFLLGFPGLAVMLRHDANRRRTRGPRPASSGLPTHLPGPQPATREDGH